MSLIDQVIPYAKAGLHHDVIAERTGISRKTVCNILHRLRERGVIPKARAALRLRNQCIKAAASKRGVTTQKLWLMVKQRVADDDLFDAVLDDGDDA